MFQNTRGLIKHIIIKHGGFEVVAQVQVWLPGTIEIRPDHGRDHHGVFHGFLLSFGVELLLLLLVHFDSSLVQEVIDRRVVGEIRDCSRFPYDRI